MFVLQLNVLIVLQLNKNSERIHGTKLNMYHTRHSKCILVIVIMDLIYEAKVMKWHMHTDLDAYAYGPFSQGQGHIIISRPTVASQWGGPGWAKSRGTPNAGAPSPKWRLYCHMHIIYKQSQFWTMLYGHPVYMGETFNKSADFGLWAIGSSRPPSHNKGERNEGRGRKGLC